MFSFSWLVGWYPCGERHSCLWCWKTHLAYTHLELQVSHQWSRRSKLVQFLSNAKRCTVFFPWNKKSLLLVLSCAAAEKVMCILPQKQEKSWIVKGNVFTCVSTGEKPWLSRDGQAHQTAWCCSSMRASVAVVAPKGALFSVQIYKAWQKNLEMLHFL